MALETRERSVTTIVSRLNAFWTSSLMNDRHIADQAWRGYLNIADNLYTQLYQLNYSKCINSISHNWISHWERFVFDDTNKVETFNALYPHAYKLPDNVKSVYLLRESPREISILPALTLLLNTEMLITPDGKVRFPGDFIYDIDELFSFEVPCGACEATGILYGETCPICDGSKKASGHSSLSGIAVDTVKYYKRADDISDYEEGITPLGDFVVDEANKIIAFAEQPYSILWSEYAIRDTEIIYDNFGSLVKFYKPDSYRYLRQLQGLWYAYWNGSTVDNIRIGLNVVTDLPFVTDAGYVSSIVFNPNGFVTSKASTEINLSERIKLPALPSEVDGKYVIILKIRNKQAYAFEQGIDFDIFYEYEDAHDYENWYSFTDFNTVNEIPSVHRQAYLKLYDTESTRQIASGDFLDIYFQDGSGDYIITVAGRDYVISDEYVPDVVVNQYLDKYTPLTTLIGVYDYINYPKWWENLLGYRAAASFFAKYGRINFNSGIAWDSGINLDSFHEHYGKTDLFYYHTFLVTLEKEAVPQNLEEVRLIRSFLDAIKPSYSHYIIRCGIDFSDDMPVREAHFCLESIFNVKSDQGPIQRFDDTWIRNTRDNEGVTFDQHDNYEKLLIAKLPLDGIRFISRTDVHSCCFDSIEANTWDSGRALDSHTTSSILEISKELP